MRKVAEALYMPMIAKNHGDAGLKALKKVLEALHRLYQHIAPEMCNGSIIVFKTLDDDDTDVRLYGGTAVNNFDALPQLVGSSFIVQVLNNGHLLLENNPPSDVHKTLSDRAVVYRYSNESEFFWAKGECKQVPKLVTAYASMFAIPTFSNLRDALEHYKTRFVRYCSCKILSGVWRDDNRIFLKNAQESVMRDSLTQFLKTTLRDVAEVRPEQNVDDSHPVDIKVTWVYAQKLALIEIKWLGTPKYDDGRLGQMYTDYRAREGAKQLADYLDSNKRQAPTHVTRGYLVLIDGRRYGLKSETISIEKAAGFYFENKEIDYDPKYHEIRDDFEIPLRMFVEPICQ
jgi:hypothetical protein